MKLITLSNGSQTEVSDEDFIYLVAYSWSPNGTGYAVAWINSRLQRMHRIIAKRMGLERVMRTNI